MMINPGLLQHKVSILRYTECVDDEGFKTREYKKIYDCRAALEKYKTKDDDFGTGTTITTIQPTLKCVIRFVNIDNNDVIEIGGKRYSIIEIEDIDFRRRFLRITLGNV